MSQNNAITPEFLWSQRKNGYRNTASAVSELVDNSLQAEAENINIILISKADDSIKRIDRVIVVDDGIGMNADILSEAIKFGGGQRHGNTRGLGKFGMGLPNSSVAQCVRFDVISKEKQSNLIHSYMR